ncbi:MAG: flagellar synthesis regulator FleN [Zetaproteobacteria bacterium CG06_land_8_20_14_3_00_59_53]|nr:MAG: flagellar synthesis regulator FleN [Zetaproteobacteria bacterium CG2_30_59_37]PIO88734.1 MAG: flagellar synthesis regulator FleN [Zetaproteobacteria bacterium CG23_combo_of_CG06-09_8_20_14_all_59_86]PIQ65409.1 MAG: flagellar synthesis regulator FleN [Zetaproteobacteria bacterium CG11_big_fil_rev_8_21_14_0_20_59_439]PIU69661.1 MAG: flagellar synthesis regulator FleN [Zetaproteobacteria bacterium CG06_land_8_20_14_3_00_59_53]PIU96907.1 MAG: flagellar synthesis regulator FleN [Zetaproteoba
MSLDTDSTADRTQTAPQVIAVASGKGGVGKTFFSLQLAARAAARGKRVLLMDADLGLANADVMLGLSAPHSIDDVLQGSCGLQDIVLPSGRGFDILPGGSGLHELTTLGTTQQQLILDEMSSLGRAYDMVVIDTGAGIGDNVLYFASASESVLIVLTPDPTSLTDAYALIKVLSRQRDIDRFMVVINQADEVESQIVFRRLLSVADRYLDVYLDFMGHLDNSPVVRRAIQSQSIFSSPDKLPPGLFNALDRIIDRPRDNSRNGGLRFFWEHSLHAALDSELQAAQQGGTR